MKRAFLILLDLGLILSITLAACGPGKIFGPTFTPTPTATSTPTHTPTPTVEPSATPTEQHAEVNPASSATTWPPDVQARFTDVLTDPWTATAAEKTAFDTYLTTQWQLTLKADGVAHAETLQGYDLLTAIVEHQPPITLTGTETPEQLASYVVELPFSLHKLLRTDQNNLVGYHHEDGRYVEGMIDPRPNSQPPVEDRGPLQKALNDWGYYYANWGLGGTESPKPDHAALVDESTYWSKPDYFGFQFYGEKIPAATDAVSIEGDAMFLFRIPGTDPNAAVGMMVRVYDGSQIHYDEAFIPFSNITTTQNDTCIMPGLGVMKTVSCPAGLSIPDVRIQAPLSSIPKDPGTLYFLLKLMSFYKNPHITLETSNGSGFVWAWKDGVPIVIVMSTPNVSTDFWKK